MSRVVREQSHLEEFPFLWRLLLPKLIDHDDRRTQIQILISHKPRPTEINHKKQKPQNANNILISGIWVTIVTQVPVHYLREKICRNQKNNAHEPCSTPGLSHT